MIYCMVLLDIKRREGRREELKISDISVEIYFTFFSSPDSSYQALKDRYKLHQSRKHS